MTQKDPSDFDPKHRIIGAVVLVALAVIFVPIILDRRGPPESPAVSDIPAADSGVENKVVVTPVVPSMPSDTSAAIGAPEEAPSGLPPAADKLPGKTDTAPKLAAEETTPSIAKTPSSVAKAAPKVATKSPQARPVALKSGWVVQVGTFANAANANRLQGQLQKHGHAVNVERIARGDANTLRLRVGPFKDKTLAVRAQGQIQRDTGIQGVVLAYP